MILYYLKTIIDSYIYSLNFCYGIKCIISPLFLSFSCIISRRNIWSFYLDNGQDTVYVMICFTLSFALLSCWDLLRKISQVLWYFGVQYRNLSKVSCLGIFIGERGIILEGWGSIRSWSHSIWIASCESLLWLSYLFFWG